MIVLVNFNSYLGGGETLFVRMAKYITEETSEKLKLFYSKKSYIADDLKRIGIARDCLCPFSGEIEYFYLNNTKKELLKSFVVKACKECNDVKLVSFCYRDLYLLVDVAKEISGATVSHLILHDEDNLYLGQSLINKLEYIFFKKKKFSNRKILDFNNKLFFDLNKANALIGEKETTKIVMHKYGIDIKDSAIVPPPMCEFEEAPPLVAPGKKILWIGRFVDFKLPAIASMLSFISAHQDYSLSLIGDGDIEFLINYAKVNNLNLNNVYFLGLQPYDKIDDIIREHSIGYACGTSIVEIGKHGLPVITALFSPNHKLFTNAICGGLYDNKYKGNEGNNLLVGESEENQPLIESVIKEIENNFDSARKKSYNCMKDDFNLSSNMNRYLKIIKNATALNYNNVNLPKCSLFRRMAFYLFAK